MRGSITAKYQRPRILRRTTPPEEISRTMGGQEERVSFAEYGAGDNRKSFEKFKSSYGFTRMTRIRRSNSPHNRASDWVGPPEDPEMIGPTLSQKKGKDGAPMSHICVVRQAELVLRCAGPALGDDEGDVILLLVWAIATHFIEYCSHQ